MDAPDAEPAHVYYERLFNNLQTNFAEELKLAGATSKLSWAEMQTMLRSVSLYRRLVDDEDEETILALADMAGYPQAGAVWRLHMSDARKQLFWRYAKALFSAALA